METLVITLPPQAYQRLQEWASRIGKPIESLTRDILEQALAQSEEHTSAQGAQEILEASGLIRPLSENLRRRIIPGVSLGEVRASLDRAGGPPLSEIINQQRGPKL